MSNIYPPWWDTTVTIYNKYKDPQTDVITWFRTVVPDCFWKHVGDNLIINDVTLKTSSIICRIRENPKFKEKYLWVNLPNDEMSQYFTLGVGDIIIKGEVTDTINEYNTGSRATDLLTKYAGLQGCIEIQEVAINIGTAKNNPHYYAQGGTGNNRYYD